MSVLKRAWMWFDDRTGLSEMVAPLAKHLVPPGTGWLYVLGSATLFAFLLQVVTGVALSMMYVPSAGEAYESLQYITNSAFLGRLLRGMHYFGASAMVLFVGIHLVRVFLMGAYKFPREMTWISGVFLLLLTLAMGFTGQLLRWDQNAVWSAVVGAEQAGRAPLVGKALARFILAGETIGGATLSRFFSYHVFLFPALIFAIVGLHLFLVIRHGISEPPKAGRPVDPKTYRAQYQAMLRTHGQPFWPYAAWRDIVFGVLVVAGIVMLAWIVGPPALDKPPDPSIIEAQPRPDWYLLWYFAVLALLPHGTEAYVIVLLPLAVGAALVLLPLLFNQGERSPARRPWAVATVVVVVLFIGVLWREAVVAPWSPHFNAPPLPASVVASSDSSVVLGARLFHQKGCENCHNVSGFGGRRGPDLTAVGNRLNREQLTIRIMNGGSNMPAFAGLLTTEELDALVAFLQSRALPSRTRPIPDTLGLIRTAPGAPTRAGSAPSQPAEF